MLMHSLMHITITNDLIRVSKFGFRFRFIGSKFCSTHNDHNAAAATATQIIRTRTTSIAHNNNDDNESSTNASSRVSASTTTTMATTTTTTNTTTNITILPQLIRRIPIRTCVGLYPTLRDIWPQLYSPHAPNQGLDLEVEYVDTFANRCLDHNDDDDDDRSSTQNKVILALHGSPGSYYHFVHLIDYFYHQRPSWNNSNNKKKVNIRVIAPNFPSFALTRSTNGVWWHSTLERTAYIRSFLEALNIREIDCLIGFSFGVHPAGMLWENPGPNLRIKSVAIFSPQTMWGQTPFMLWLYRTLAFSFRSEWWYQLLEQMKIHKFPLWPAKFKSINDYLLVSSCVLDHHIPRDIGKRIGLFANATVPIPAVLMYGSKERLIDHKSVRRCYHEFGVDNFDRDVIRIDPSSSTSIDTAMMNMSSGLKQNKRLHPFLLEGGGHFAHSQFPNVTNRVVETLLKTDYDDHI